MLKEIISQDFVTYTLTSAENTTLDDETIISNVQEIDLGQDFTRDETKAAQCKPINEIENNSNFLLRHIQVVSIVYFYYILDSKIFGKSYELALNYLRDEEALLKDINRKIEQYNNYVGDIYKEICEAEIKPAPPAKVEKISNSGLTEIEYADTDIYTYYKDMIFSIFDKEAK